MMPRGNGKVIVSYGVGHKDAPYQESYLISYEEENKGPELSPEIRNMMKESQPFISYHPWTWHRQTMDSLEDAIIYAVALAKKYDGSVELHIGNTKDEYIRGLSADNLDDEIKFFEDIKDQLILSDNGKYVLIHGRALIDVFYSKEDAIKRGYELYGNAPFLVRKIGDS
jgi:hypothetical protein